MAGLTCDNRAAWDENDQPIGPACGEPVTHIIVWTTNNAWSASCALHHTEDHFKDAPPHTVYEIADFYRLGLG